MNFRTFAKSTANNKIGSPLYAVLILLVTAKVLWGYWDRDLTYGDTSSYFLDAARWHLKSQINIVWSPLYTMYFGSWLSITENANVATFLHRTGLIIASTGLIAWLGFLTLPRFLALAFTVWWVALPIHYDTLYEVHLFGALPILVMAIVSIIARGKWRWPLLLGIAVISTFLIRNEYILAVGVFAALAGFSLFRKRDIFSLSEIRLGGLRTGATLIASGLLITYFYSISSVKGSAIAEASAPKHTLNMCQVYAFGYQQRHSDWTGSPWTECSSLMKTKFDTPMPTLSAMIIANPGAVMEHFLWNLSLTRAGAEVLLFNATSARDNPDYAPVLIIPVIPSLFLGITLVICIGGAIVVFRRSSVQHEEIREKLTLIAPLLSAALVMGIAIIITQRPRPSYFLGLGVLYMWMVSIMLSVFLNNFRKIDALWPALFLTILVLLMPAYRSLPLPSKMGSLGLMYDELQPQAHRLCQGSGLFAANDYASEINNYLCAPYRFGAKTLRSSVMSLGSLPAAALSTPSNLVLALDDAGAKALVIDPFLTQKYQGLRDCHELHDALANRGWEQLTYSSLDSGRCIAAYVK